MYILLQLLVKGVYTLQPDYLYNCSTNLTAFCLVDIRGLQGVVHDVPLSLILCQLTKASLAALRHYLLSRSPDSLVKESAYRLILSYLLCCFQLFMLTT